MTDGQPGSFEVPPGTDLRALTQSLAPPAGGSHGPAAGPPGHGPRPPATRRAGRRGRPGRLGAARREVRRERRVRRRGAGLRRGRRRAGARGRARVRRTTAAGSGRPAPSRRSHVMSGARDQVARLLALVPYIQARREVELDQAAADFGVSQAQIVKDLNVLWFCGMPGLGMGDLIDVDMDALEGEGVIRLSNAEYLSRPLRLDSSEASALIVALRALREGSDDDVRPIVDRTLGKLEAAAGDGAAAGGPGRRPDAAAGRAARRAARPALATRSTTGARCGSTTTSPPATSPPSASSTRCGWSAPTGTPTSRPTATSPRTSGCSGSTGSRAPRCSTRRWSRTPTSSRGTSPTASSSPRPTTCW